MLQRRFSGIHSQILGLANAKGIRGYLFAGSRTNQAAFSSLSAYQGDSYEHRIETGPNSEVAISSSGELAFTALGGRDVFQDLSDLTTALQTNNLVGIQASLDRLDADHEQVVRERARTGVNLARLEQSTAMHENSRHLLDIQKSDLSGIDPTDSLSMLSELEQALTVSTSVLRQLLQLGDRQF